MWIICVCLHHKWKKDVFLLCFGPFSDAKNVMSALFNGSTSQALDRWVHQRCTRSLLGDVPLFSMAIWRGECWSNGWSTLWLCQQFAIENGHRNSGVIFHSYVNVYQRVMVISLGCKKPLIWEKEATGSIKPSDTGQTCSDPKRQRQQFQKPTLISQFSILEAVGLLWDRLSLKKEVVNTINSLVIYEYHWNIIKDLWS